MVKLFRANLDHFATVESDLMRDMLNAWPEKLKNCENCGVIKRRNEWCHCDAGEKAKTEFEGGQQDEPPNAL